MNQSVKTSTKLLWIRNCSNQQPTTHSPLQWRHDRHLKSI